MTAAAQPTPADSIRRRRIKRFVRNPIGMAAAAVLLSILLLAVFARQLAPYDPNLIELSETLLPPSGSPRSSPR